MKNKSFKTLSSAQSYFNRMQDTHVCFLIHNREEGTYEVIDQDLYDHYVQEFDLDMDVIDFIC